MHNLEFVDGKAAMAYVGEVPWHENGEALEPGCSPLEMRKRARVDWEVRKFPLTWRFRGEDHASAKMALVRLSDNKEFDVVGPDWNPVQNAEAFDFFAEFCEAGKMEMETAGALDGGRLVWAMAKVKGGAFEVVKNDLIETRVLFTNPHIYGKSVDIRYTSVRVVCQNTLVMALKGSLNNAISDEVKSTLRLNHSRPFNAELAKQALGLTMKTTEEYAQKARFLASKAVTDEQISEYVNAVFPIKRAPGKESRGKTSSAAAKTVLKIVDTQPGVQFGEGTWWQAFNAITYATDHLLGNGEDTRLTSAWYGTNQRLKVDALNKAMEMAMAA